MIIQFPELHAAQMDILRQSMDKRRVVTACGRRFGKNLLGTERAMLTASDGGAVCHVSVSFAQSRYEWHLLCSLCHQLPEVTINESAMCVTFPSKGRIQVTNAERPLLGETLDLVICDEFAYWSDGMAVWREQLEPALLERRGTAWFISSPNGLNHFWRLYVRGLDPEQRDWVSFQYPSSANPYISAQDLDTLRRSLPERTIRQDFYGEFVPDDKEQS